MLRKEVQLLIAVGGIYFCYFKVGLIQEHLFKSNLGTMDFPSPKFEFSSVLIFLQMLIYNLLCLAMILKNKISFVCTIKEGAYLGLLNFSSMIGALTALQYVTASTYSSQLQLNPVCIGSWIGFGQPEIHKVANTVWVDHHCGNLCIQHFLDFRNCFINNFFVLRWVSSNFVEQIQSEEIGTMGNGIPHQSLEFYRLNYLHTDTRQVHSVLELHSIIPTSYSRNTVFDHLLCVGPSVHLLLHKLLLSTSVKCSNDNKKVLHCPLVYYEFTITSLVALGVAWELFMGMSSRIPAEKKKGSYIKVPYEDEKKEEETNGHHNKEHKNDHKHNHNH
ncbi:unnamed protein product (macronuclear) [Paramecium tetraurelia]|uniref:Uncharacterized protein n=1 Tax=Paramecium tetraurelia TaxID=5888 RepID=A0DMK5_PARTE|nr:uncharacterized protein GSPATT00018490001 [Paramecium tetraurelia]CAK84272.1 unnamed protein product [Paramecium tetraurelia]|eukprot:XP_001451669.1 hypothetical protein (macronuclear) [Paramecium tetraurelia strain d4-2]